VIMFRRAAALASSVAVLLIAGCGGGGASDNGVAGKSAQDILNDAATALSSAQSVHLAGIAPATTASAATGNTGAVNIDVKLSRTGDADGTIKVQGANVRIIVVKGAIYLKSKQLFEQVGGAQAAALLDDNWVKLSVTAPGASQITSGIGQLTDFTKLADNLRHPTGTVSKGGQATINGQSAIAVSDSQSTLYVATTGKAYPLQVQSKSDSSQKLNFTEYDQNLSVTAPGGALDISQLLQGLSGQGTSSSTSTTSTTTSSPSTEGTSSETTSSETTSSETT